MCFFSHGVELSTAENCGVHDNSMVLERPVGGPMQCLQATD